MKVVLIVLDSFGVGEMPDADLFGDKGSNTYLNTYKKTKVDLINLASLGLNNIDGINLSNKDVSAKYGKMKELTFAKDTTAGHYEICGVVLNQPYPTFPGAFPKELIDKLQKELNITFIGNEVASGTEIIKRLGQKHLQSGCPIVYTSADSVLQIATHIDKFSVEQLYDLCKKARKVCCGKYNIGRIIARPFATNKNGEFYRLEARRDYALEPPKPTLLDKLKQNNFDVVCIGKIADIFCNRGVTESYHSKNNAQGIEEIKKHTKRTDINGLIFANLNDTDSLYGHRNDYKGYANALKDFDNNLPEIINNLQDEDILIITADHGCDPTTPSTDHSREYVPILIYSKSAQQNINLGTLNGFDVISKSILDLFNIEKYKNNILK
ncbi:MAG: phosphopentomutase [Clostridia bacterium]|nr:phosphopentomutase [Clostridia bacterium]MBQ3047614.1 phosphopentomutase [Clostridia bacterium]